MDPSLRHELEIPKRKALLIGVTYEDNDTHETLGGPRRDVLELQKVLIGKLFLEPVHWKHHPS